MNIQDIDLTNYREQYSYYAKQLLSDLGLADLPMPQRTEVLVIIERYVQQVILNTILENMNEDTLAIIESEMNRGTDSQFAVTEAIASIPGLDMKIADALAATYSQMVNEARQLSVALTKKEEILTSPKTDEAQDETPAQGTDDQP